MSAVRFCPGIAVRHRRGRSDRRQPELCPSAATARLSCPSRCRLPGSARNISGDDIGSAPVQAAAGPVIAHRRSRIGVRGRLLHIA
jgi:hypothetical protein